MDNPPKKRTPEEIKEMSIQTRELADKFFEAAKDVPFPVVMSTITVITLQAIMVLPEPSWDKTIEFANYQLKDALKKSRAMLEAIK